MTTALYEVKNLELETVEVGEVKLDVYFTYNKDYGFELYSVEDITGTQDLTAILPEWVLNAVEKGLEDIYRSCGWL